MAKAKTIDIVKYIKMVLITIVLFYSMFPQAIAIRGSSFILYSGISGLGLYILHKNPFPEVKKILFVFFIFIGIMYFAEFQSGFTEPFARGYLRSQIAWFFSAYMIVFFIFKVHKEPTADVIVIYLIAALFLQALITTLMYAFPAVKDFLFSFQLQTEIDASTKDEIERQRLLGYGVALFGSGVALGYCLILMMYFIVKTNFNKIQLLLMALLYVFVFYIGLFSARTTTVGLAMSLGMIVLLRLPKNKGRGKQTLKFIGILAGLLAIGASLCFAYFPAFTDWAFEMFYSYINYRSLETRSSNGLSGMLYAPKDIDTLLFGSGSVDITGSDVGYTRLLFYVGIPGMIAYFMIGMVLCKMSLSKDWNMNLLLILTLGYVFAMNFKGLTDVYFILELYFFYFMFYRYKVYMPKLRLKQMQMARQKREQMLQNKNKLDK